MSAKYEHAIPLKHWENNKVKEICFVTPALGAVRLMYGLRKKNDTFVALGQVKVA